MKNKLITITSAGKNIERLTLKSLVTSIPVSIAVYDMDMNIVSASKKWLLRYGLEEENVLGKNYYSLFTNVSDDWRMVHKRCLAGATEKKDHDIFYMPNGKVEYVRWEITPWKKEDESIGGIIIYSEIITEAETIRLGNVKLIRELNLLNEVENIIYNATDDFDVIDEVCKKIIQMGGYQLVWFGFAPDPLHDKQLIYPMHKYGSAVHYLDNFMIDLNNDVQKNGPTSTALRTGKTQAVNDFSDSLFFSPWLQNAITHNIHASISLPISLIDGQKCVLCIYSETTNVFDLPEIGILERLANKVTYALNAIKLRYDSKVALIKQDKLIKDLSLRNRSLEDFTYLVSHNFRAKVADLLGVSALISEHTLSEADTKELNGEVGRIAQKLDEVIRDLHNTLLVKGHAMINTDNIDLSRMFSDLKQNLNTLLPDTHINLITDFSQANYLKTDRYYLFEACLQLMLNFVKHSEGRTYTQIKAYSNKTNDKTQLILEDEQLGFRLKDNDDSISVIYRKLYQHLNGGSIKLLYVKAIIENMGGVFSVNCEEHNNIKFIIEYAE